MNCYNHNQSAVGICRACYKGICLECTSKEAIVSCNNQACVKIANELVGLVDKSKNQLSKSYIFGIIYGLFFIVIGYQFYSMHVSLGLTFSGLGAVILGYSICTKLGKLCKKKIN